MTVPAYSITISPASMFLLQKSPRPWISDLKKDNGGSWEHIIWTFTEPSGRTVPVNSYGLFRDLFQVSESHRHGKLTAGGPSVTAKHRNVGWARMAYIAGVLFFRWGWNWIKMADFLSCLEDFRGKSSSSSSKGPVMSGSSLCCDARKLNISKVAFLFKQGERPVSTWNPTSSLLLNN